MIPREGYKSALMTLENDFKVSMYDVTANDNRTSGEGGRRDDSRLFPDYRRETRRSVLAQIPKGLLAMELGTFRAAAYTQNEKRNPLILVYLL